MALYYLDSFNDYYKFDGIVDNNQNYDCYIDVRDYRHELSDGAIICKYMIRINLGPIIDKENLEAIISDIYLMWVNIN
ncbi:MAG: hypothetical protein GX490_00025 [Bacilli bacterium]|nr:hypothetical protein [Bacilli bacterium]